MSDPFCNSVKRKRGRPSSARNSGSLLDPDFDGVDQMESPESLREIMRDLDRATDNLGNHNDYD